MHCLRRAQTVYLQARRRWLDVAATPAGRGGEREGGGRLTAMWPFSRVKKASVPRLVDLDLRLSDVETMIQWLKKANQDLNARVSVVLRREKSRDDAPGPTNDPPPDTRQVPIFPREKSRRGF